MTKAEASATAGQEPTTSQQNLTVLADKQLLKAALLAQVTRTRSEDSLGTVNWTGALAVRCWTVIISAPVVKDLSAGQRLVSHASKVRLLSCLGHTLTMKQTSCKSARQVITVQEMKVLVEFLVLLEVILMATRHLLVCHVNEEKLLPVRVLPGVKPATPANTNSTALSAGSVTLAAALL